MRASDEKRAGIGPEEAAPLVESGEVLLVDVRTAAERDAGHIGGSTHIELARLAVEAGTLERDRPVLLYCRIGERSAMAAEALAASGWDARNLEGGIVAWAAAGLPLEPEGGRIADHGGLPPR